MRSTVLLAVLAIAAASACRGGGSRPAPVAPPTPTPAITPSPTPTQIVRAAALPDDEGGRLIARAIEAAGGWSRWQHFRDVSFVSTLTIFDRIGSVLSETILLQRSVLHQGIRTRVDSIGLSEEVVLGLEGGSDWMLHDGKAVNDPLRSAFTRFNALISHFSFGLPFILAESPVRLSYVGSEVDGRHKWEKVRVDFLQPETAPADWLVLYLDADDGLIGQVFAHVTVEFLRHPLWMSKLREYREWDGIKKERRRTIFPADETGAVIGNMSAEQLVEHVRFDTGVSPEIFTKPLVAGGGSPAA